MGWTFLDNEIIISSAGAALITAGAAFADVDLSTVVPAGTTLVQLHIRNSSPDTAYVSGVRYNGNTAYTSTDSLPFGEHTFVFAFLDANRIFEGYFANDALLVGIIAYTDTATPRTTYIDVTPASAGEWLDKDISASIPAGSTVAFLNRANTGRNHAFRANGSSMDINSVLGTKEANGMSGAVVGLDSNGIYEHIIASVYNVLSIYLQGADDQIIELSDKTDLGPGSSNAWTDCDCTGIVPAGSIAALVLIKFKLYNATPRILTVRPKVGSADNFVTNTKTAADQSNYVLVGLDENLKFEGYTGLYANTSIYVIGYIPGPSTPAANPNMFLVL